VALGVRFQHWIYTHHEIASDPALCDTTWLELVQCFLPGIDLCGLEPYVASRWRRNMHFFVAPFQWIEYGLAMLGAVQIWANGTQDQAGALRQYREALALGNTATLPELYRTAGAKLAFDAGTLGQAVGLIEDTIAELEAES
jgi:oligoendopeptidase F